MKSQTRRERGLQADEVVDWFETALLGLARLRTPGAWKLDGSRDEQTLDEISTCITDVTQLLAPRLSGLAEALVRAHLDAGGSLGELAAAMGVPRATAQSRARRVSTEQPSVWEEWATTSTTEANEGDTVRTIPGRSQGNARRDLPKALVDRWGADRVRAILTPIDVLSHSADAVETPQWDPCTAAGVYLQELGAGDPETAVLVFRTADGRWIKRETGAAGARSVGPDVVWHYLSPAGARQWLEDTGHRGVIRRHMPAADQ